MKHTDRILIEDYHWRLEEEERKVEKLEAQRDDLLAACKMALKRKPFPVGATRAREMLEHAVAKAEGREP